MSLFSSSYLMVKFSLLRMHWLFQVGIPRLSLSPDPRKLVTSRASPHNLLKFYKEYSCQITEHQWPWDWDQLILIIVLVPLVHLVHSEYLHKNDEEFIVLYRIRVNQIFWVWLVSNKILEFFHLCWKKQVHQVEFPDQKRLPFLQETSEL